MTAGTFPRPKSIMAGIRYTKLGMVCMASSTGFINSAKYFASAIRTPRGMPMAREMTTDVMTSASVSRARGHSPNMPINTGSAARTTVGMIFLVAIQAIMAIKAMYPHQGMDTRIP